MDQNFFTYRIVRGLLCFGFVFLLVLTPFALSLTSQSAGLSVAYAQTPPAEPSYWEEFWKWNNSINVFGSLLRPAFASIAALVIQLAVVIMQIASGLFDMLVTRTIIGFGDTTGLLNPGVQQAINVAWSAFRDLANILIIGFFTFIAINIILGSPTFGQKRLIANVLIVAILINFSLLFTKIIIDFSNYTATQFYIASVGRPTPAQGNTPASAPEGIGDRFLRITKASSLAETGRSVNKVGEESGNWFMLLYALVIFALLLGAAMVLFYGSFILISRAILLVFLMVTAALAFATYLMPANSPLNHWGAWWRSLIQSAVLAPVLIIFLWATLRVSESLRSTGTLGDLANNPNSASNLGALFSYIIILGLLFAAFKISSSFSMSIAGFNWSSAVTAIPFAAGSRLASSAIRGTSFAAGKGLGVAGARLSASNSRLATLGGGLLNATGKGLEAFSTRQHQLMGTAVGAVVAKQTKGILSQQTLKGAAKPPIGSSVASQSAAKAIEKAAQAALAKKPGAQKALPGGTSGPGTPPPPGNKPPGTGAPGAALPRAGAAPLPIAKPATPAGTPPAGAGAHMTTTDESGKVAAIKKDEQARAEAAKAATTATQEDHKAVAAEIKEAVGAASGSAANDNTVKALEKQSEQNRAAMKEMGAELTAANAQSAEKIGTELKTAATGIREATTTTGKALTESVQGVQDMARRATEIQTKAIEKQEDRDTLGREAAIEHGKSESRSRDYEAMQRTMSAAEKAQEATRVQHFADIKNKHAPMNDNHANDNVPPADQSSSIAPMSTPATGRFAAQPYTQASVYQPAPGIPLHQGAVDANTLLKEIRENRERNIKQLRDGFRIIKGGKEDQPK